MIIKNGDGGSAREIIIFRSPLVSAHLLVPPFYLCKQLHSHWGLQFSAPFQTKVLKEYMHMDTLKHFNLDNLISAVDLSLIPSALVALVGQ